MRRFCVLRSFAKLCTNKLRSDNVNADISDKLMFSMSPLVAASGRKLSGPVFQATTAI